MLKGIQGLLSNLPETGPLPSSRNKDSLLSYVGRFSNETMNPAGGSSVGPKDAFRDAWSTFRDGVNNVGTFAGAATCPAATPALTLSAESFHDGWRSYCMTNPRLRNPKVLQSLVRCGVPEDLRPEVWLHCLGVDSSSSRVSGATIDSFGAAGVRSVNDLAESNPDVAIVAGVKGSSSSITEPTGSTVASTDCIVASSVDDQAGRRSQVAAASREDGESLVANRPPVSEVASAAHQSANQADDLCVKGSCQGSISGVQEDTQIPARTAEQIDADILRTFPTLPEFQEMNGPDRLRRILRALAVRDSQLGYCQAMNYIAAVFLLVLKDDHQVCQAVSLTLEKRLGTRRYYTDGMNQLRADTAVLEELCHERLPTVYRAFRNHGLEFMFVCSKWFLCLFVTTLEGETLRRVWDVLLCDGIEAMFRVSLALLWRRADAIDRAKSLDDLINLLQKPEADISAADLLAVSYSSGIVGTMGRAELAQRRQAAAARVSADDARMEMRQNQFWRGGVRPASIANAAR